TRAREVRSRPARSHRFLRELRLSDRHERTGPMISLACPACGRPLEFADDLAGSETACYACRNPLTVPAAPKPPPLPAINPDHPPAPPPFPTYGSWRYERPCDYSPPRRSYGAGSYGGGFFTYLGWRFGFAIVVLAIGSFGLVFSGGNINIVVDNG